MDIALDAAGDIVFPSRFISDAERVAQAVVILLKTHKGEWASDASLGVDYMAVTRRRKVDIVRFNLSARKILETSVLWVVDEVTTTQVGDTLRVDASITLSRTLAITASELLNTINIQNMSAFYVVRVNKARSM